MFYCWYKSLLHRIEQLLFSAKFGKWIQKRVKRVVEEVLFSDEFRSYLITIIQEAKKSPFKDIAEQYIGEQVEINTTAGLVRGMILTVDDDYLTVNESVNTTVIIPFRSIVSIRRD
ncbi:DUF2642 domain-containing protein [Bacillus sp. CGMCC 1.16541]|uniref:DUF2642 domain-containing protein n=1 Tax=Bacillus sp. CGMCC 1.16541 TaxID=2185143 RepID=UPI000D731083|nr:DUF2642 domain-containing protein [Bacillus sp. CGMCC 1.16541]